MRRVEEQNKIFVNNTNELHSQNKPDILIILFVFHFDISGNDFNEIHPQNKKQILFILLVFHFLI